MIIDWGDIIKEGLKLIVPVVGIVAPLAYQQRKARMDARAEAKLAREERRLATVKVGEMKDELVEVKKNVDGHLSKLTASLAREATANTALTVENDRLNEGTTTTPATQTPNADAHLTRDAATGVATSHERRKPDADV